MKLYLLVLGVFLLAFVGLSVGLLMKGRRLRGGCGHDPGAKHDCTCKTTPSRSADDNSTQ